MAVAVVGVDIVVCRGARSKRGLGWVLTECFAAQAGCDAHRLSWAAGLGVQREDWTASEGALRAWGADSTGTGRASAR